MGETSVPLPSIHVLRPFKSRYMEQTENQAAVTAPSQNSGGSTSSRMDLWVSDSIVKFKTLRAYISCYLNATNVWLNRRCIQLLCMHLLLMHVTGPRVVHFPVSEIASACLQRLPFDVSATRKPIGGFPRPTANTFISLPVLH